MRTVFPYRAEDQFKAEFFDLSRPGFFVEVGANQPQHDSQTWRFEQAGWTEILVEPLGEIEHRLRRAWFALPMRILRDHKRWLRARLRQWLPQSALVPADLISVIVTTYNREDALAAVLRALSRQSDRNFEIIVADDGSRIDTRRVIESWRACLPVPIKHVRHEHDGFRGAEIRNRGIRASAGKYCIFLDGDCLPRADFIGKHRALAEAGWFVTGNRILLSRDFTVRVLGNGIGVECWSFFALVREWLRGGVNRLLPALRLPLGPLRKLPRDWQGVQSCNLAAARSDLDTVDGFDASYTGWGREDSDLVVRLLHAGVRRKDGRLATGVLHLWHEPNDRSQLSVNDARLHQSIDGERARALCGLSALADDVAIYDDPLRRGG